MPVETVYLVGSVLSQAGVISVAGLMIKRWMDKVDSSLEKTQEELRNNAAALATQVEGVHVELKLANGRTAKLEGKIEVQRAICEERHDK